MNTTHRIAALALIVGGAIGGAIAAAPDSEETARQCEAAMEAYERNHWLGAYTQLAHLADLGHADAARVASQMVACGPTLYAMQFSTTPQQAERWTELRARQAKPGQ